MPYVSLHAVPYEGSHVGRRFGGADGGRRVSGAEGGRRRTRGAAVAQADPERRRIVAPVPARTEMPFDRGRAAGHGRVLTPAHDRTDGFFVARLISPC